MSGIVKLLAACIIIGIGSGVDGLRCWSCRKMISNEECVARGKVQNCPANQACVNSILRSNDGSKYEITKGCRRKNSPVCKNRDTQNVGMYPMQCSYNNVQSVCQCCCDTNSCNGPQIECKDVITCKKPDNPGNGRVTCPRSVDYGTKCTVKCNRGYRRQGAKFIICTNGTDQGYWEPRSTPSCLPVSKQSEAKKPVQCNAKLTAPKFGSMVCENRGEYKEKTTFNYIGTICAFKCDSGYFQTGPEIAFCLPGGRWSVSAPLCTKGMCQRPPQDKNRIDNCSDKMFFGSVCTSSCADGYRLIGSLINTCNSVNDVNRQGRWSGEFGKCRRALCRPDLIKPPNGKLSCVNKNFLGSVCTFTCDDGYDIINEGLEGFSKIECVQNGEVIEWNAPSPKCVKIICPRVERPSDGSVSCIGDGSIGSKCTYTCNAGFDLVGTSEASQETVCRNSGNGNGIGLWSLDAVTCAPIKCLPEHKAPMNGKLYCTNKNNVGSICTFTCDDEYDMDGTVGWFVLNECLPDPAGDGIGKWTNDPVTCSQRYTCQEVPVKPEHGSVDCDKDASKGSVCQFSCDEGYEIRGFDRVTCRDVKYDGDNILEWSDEAPTCVPSTCPTLWYDTIDVKVECNAEQDDNEYPIGTKCTYSCARPGHYIEGETEITCTAKNKWSANTAPRCFEITCPPIGIIENGNQPECSSGIAFQSECRFKCNQKYSLSHTDALVCEVGDEGKKVGIWDRKPPKCVLSECLTLPKTPSMGEVKCSSGTSIGSFCTLECAQGYAPKVARIDCQQVEEKLESGVRKVPKFLQMQDFCCAKCRSDFHIAQIIDFRFNRNLQSIIGFTKMLLTQLLGQENQAYFSTVSYNREVDQSSVIARTKIDTDSIDDVIQQMSEWKLEKQGEKSDTSSALNFGNDQLFEGLDNNAASFLIVAADDAPDNVRPGTIAKILDRGINIIVAASNNYAKLTWGKLLGGNENVVNQDANEIMQRIFNMAFANGCSNTAPKCV